MMHAHVIAGIAHEIAHATGWSEHDALTWTIENAVGGDMVPVGAGPRTWVSGEDRAVLLDVATHTGADGVYRS